MSVSRTSIYIHELLLRDGSPNELHIRFIYAEFKAKATSVSCWYTNTQILVSTPVGQLVF